MLRWNVRVAAASACLIGGAVIVARQPTGPYATAIEIPVEFGTKQPIVQVKVNGGAPMPFVVDTGASIHLLDREIARQADVGAGEARTMHGGGQASVETSWVDGVRLEFGGLLWTGQRAALAPLGYPLRKHFAGLIGAPILMRYAVRFDLEAKTMRLTDPLAYEPSSGALRVPFELQDDLPVIRVKVDAGSGPIVARLMVDTGAGTSIDLNRPFVEAHGLVDAVADTTSEDRPAALGGTAPFLYATGRSASIEGESIHGAGRRSIGGVVFGQPRLGLSRATTGSSASGARDGIIGTELLRRYPFTVDYRRRLLVLETAEAR